MAIQATLARPECKRQSIEDAAALYAAFIAEAVAVDPDRDDMDGFALQRGTSPRSVTRCMMRRSVMEAHGLRSNANWSLPAEDYLFTITWSAHALYANLPQVLVDYRIGEQNQRHGRDPVADRAAVCREVFRYFGIALTEEELDVHLLLHQLVRCPVDAALARRLAQWEQELIDRAEACGRFPMDVFRAEVGRRCAKAFYLLADRDLGAALAHMRQFGLPSGAALKYLAGVTLNRWTHTQRDPQR